MSDEGGWSDGSENENNKDAEIENQF